MVFPQRFHNQNFIQTYSTDAIHVRGDERLIKCIPRAISEISSDTRQYLKPHNSLVSFLDLTGAAPIVHLCLQES